MQLSFLNHCLCLLGLITLPLTSCTASDGTGTIVAPPAIAQRSDPGNDVDLRQSDGQSAEAGGGADSAVKRPSTPPSPPEQAGGDGGQGVGAAPQPPSPLGEQNSPKPADSKPPEAPYAEGTWINYVWLKNGEEAGKYSFRVERNPEKLEHRQSTGVFRYRHDGRIIHMEIVSELDQELQPVAMHQTVQYEVTSIANAGNALTVQAVFDAGKVSTEVKVASDANSTKQEYSVEPPYYLYEDFSFDHWALFAPELRKRGEGEYRFFRPSSGRTFKIKFAKKSPLMMDGKRVELWTFEHLEFSGNLWLAENGSLEKYQQGILEVFRGKDSDELEEEGAPAKPLEKR